MKTKVKISLFFALSFSICLLNGQILKTYSNGTIHIGNTAMPLFEPSNTHFQIDAPLEKKSVVSGSKTASGKVYVSGIQFIPSAALVPTGGGLSRQSGVMIIAGLENKRASIGSSTNNMYRVYAEDCYLSGNSVGAHINSDLRLKNNIRELKPISERILNLRPVTYDFIKTSTGEDVSENPAYKDRTGFIAQEVGKLFPDLVVIDDESGLYSLDYAGLIPYLTKGFQEQSEIIRQQSEEINELRKIINDIQMGFYAADFVIGNNEAGGSQQSQINNVPQNNEIENILFQNTPNPFNISTNIKYQLSDNVTNAKICIYNLTGKQLQYYTLLARKGENAIEVRASSLQSGMYLYSLIVGDNLIDTKRMVLTE